MKEVEQGLFFRLSVREKVVCQKLVGLVDVAPESSDRDLAYRVSYCLQQFDIWEQFFVLVSQGLSQYYHLFSPFHFRVKQRDFCSAEHIVVDTRALPSRDLSEQEHNWVSFCQQGMTPCSHLIAAFW